jgi:hypothetical protein
MPDSPSGWLPTQKTMFNPSKSIRTWGWLWQRHFAASQANALGHRRKPNSNRLKFPPMPQ